MRSFAKIGFVAVGLGLVLSVAACAVVGESSESSSADVSQGRPGRGRPPRTPIIADEDAAPPVAPGPGLAPIDPDASVPAPAADDDAAAPTPVADEDAGPIEPPMDPPPDPTPATDDDAGIAP